MNVYRLKVEIVGLKKVYRIIEATANSTFQELHDAIFEAFVGPADTRCRCRELFTAFTERSEWEQQKSRMRYVV